MSDPRWRRDRRAGVSDRENGTARDCGRPGPGAGRRKSRGGRGELGSVLGRDCWASECQTALRAWGARPRFSSRPRHPRVQVGRDSASCRRGVWGYVAPT